MARQGDAGDGSGTSNQGISGSMSGSASSFAPSSSSSSSQDAYNKRQGFGVGLTADGLGPGTTLKDVADRIGMTEDGVREAFNNPSTFSKITDKLPGMMGVALRFVAQKVGPDNIFGKDGVISAPATAAVAASTDPSFATRSGSSSGNSAGDPTQTGAAAPAAPQNIMGDLWSSIGMDPATFGGAATTQRTPITYQADPTGMMGQAAAAYTDYQKGNAPLLDAMGKEVNNLNSPEYLAQQRGKAMAGVQQQSGIALDAQKRDLMRMGVNPGSGKMLAMGNQNAIKTAAAKVQAGGMSDATNKQNYIGGMGTMLSSLGDRAKTGYSFGTLGQQSAQNANSFNLANDQSNLSWTENAQKHPMQWAQLGLNKYATDKGVAQTQMNLDAKSSSDNKSLIGMGLTLGANALMKKDSPLSFLLGD